MLRIEEVGGAASDIERALNEVSRLQDPFRIDRPDHNIDRVFLETFQLPEVRDRKELPVNKKAVESLALSPSRHVGVESFSRLYQRRKHLERPTLGGRLELADDRGNALFFYRQITIRTKLRSGFREKKP